MSTPQAPTSETAAAKSDNTYQPYVPGSISIAYVTAPNAESAKHLARGLIEQRLAACVNVVPNVTSIYRWDGKVQEDSEVMLIVKTETELVSAVSKFVQANHSYEVAEVISTKVENGNESYLRFVHNAIHDK